LALPDIISAAVAGETLAPAIIDKVAQFLAQQRMIAANAASMFFGSLISTDWSVSPRVGASPRISAILLMSPVVIFQ
jgi:hypothetical protein